MTAVPCIICHKDLKAIEGSPSPNHAGDANSFRSSGQYGSTVFDPLNGTFIEINICDECLVSAAENKCVLHGSNRDDLTLWKYEK